MVHNLNALWFEKKKNRRTIKFYVYRMERQPSTVEGFMRSGLLTSSY